MIMRGGAKVPPFVYPADSTAPRAGLHRVWHTPDCNTCDRLASHKRLILLNKMEWLGR